MRALARFLRSSSACSKRRTTASETFRYSSIGTNSRRTVALRGMMLRPPPVTISKPFTPSRMRGMKPRSWMPVIALVLVGGREGDLELARQELAQRVAQPEARKGRAVGRRVEQFVRR